MGQSAQTCRTSPSLCQVRCSLRSLSAPAPRIRLRRGPAIVPLQSRPCRLARDRARRQDRHPPARVPEMFETCGNPFGRRSTATPGKKRSSTCLGERREVMERSALRCRANPSRPPRRAASRAASTTDSPTAERSQMFHVPRTALPTITATPERSGLGLLGKNLSLGCGARSDARATPSLTSRPSASSAAACFGSSSWNGPPAFPQHDSRRRARRFRDAAAVRGF